MRTFQEITRYFDSRGAGEHVFIVSNFQFSTVFFKLSEYIMFDIEGNRLDLSVYNCILTLDTRKYIIITPEQAKELKPRNFYHL